jgi:uncharacterized surface protein with fasciclin (FAS1) repeats
MHEFRAVLLRNGQAPPAGHRGIRGEFAKKKHGVTKVSRGVAQSHQPAFLFRIKLSEILKIFSKMKKQVFFWMAVPLGLWLSSCRQAGNEQTAGTAAASTEQPAPAGGGQASVVDENSEPNVVKVAVGSPDHTTLVAALKAAGLVDAMANVGPFTVFAPTNAAFDALPPGTVEDLLKPEKKADLTSVLKYHVTTSSLSEVMLSDGMSLSMANGGKATIKKSADGKLMINDANVLGTVKASNGMVYVIDKVLLPK